MRGNRCGHDRRHIRRSLRRGGSGKRGPLVLHEAARAFARAIIERPRDFPELTATRISDRARRSERLEAIGLVVLALMVRCDLLSLVVRWKGEGLAEELIARWTGMDERRVRRALFDLRWGCLVRGPGKMGPNRIPQPVEKYTNDDGSSGYRGKHAIRQITILLFERVGMDGWLAEEQSRRWAELHPDRKVRRAPTPSAVALQISSLRREVRLLAERPPPD